MKTLAVVISMALYGCGGAPFTAGVDSVDAGDADGSQAVDTNPLVLDGSSAVDSASVDAAVDTMSDSVAIDSISVDAGPDACTPVTHNNGEGQTWMDCVPLDTYNEAQAMKACVADVDAGGGCYSVTRPCNSDGVESAVCSAPSTTTFCWTYAGMYSGYAAPAPGCPTGSDPMWN